MNLVFKQSSLKIVRNERAFYNFCELKDFIDFEVKRVYFIQDCNEATGQHCHKLEKEFFVLQRGECTAIIDRGHGKEEIKMQVSDGLYVGNYVWHGFKDFSSDAMLLALSSTNYSQDRSDYVEDYNQYKEIIKG